MCEHEIWGVCRVYGYMVIWVYGGYRAYSVYRVYRVYGGYVGYIGCEGSIGYIHYILAAPQPQRNYKRGTDGVEEDTFHRVRAGSRAAGRRGRR